MYEKMIESYKGLLLLALSYIVYNKYQKIIYAKKLDRIEREKQQIAKEKEIERKNNMRKLKRYLDEEQCNKEKELRKKQKQVHIYTNTSNIKKRC
jgi:hypothetical protein